MGQWVARQLKKMSVDKKNDDLKGKDRLINLFSKYLEALRTEVDRVPSSADVNIREVTEITGAK